MPDRIDRKEFFLHLQPFAEWLRKRGYRWPAEPWKQQKLIAEFKLELDQTKRRRRDSST